MVSSRQRLHNILITLGNVASLMRCNKFLQSVNSRLRHICNQKLVNETQTPPESVSKSMLKCSWCGLTCWYRALTQLYCFLEMPEQGSTTAATVPSVNSSGKLSRNVDCDRIDANGLISASAQVSSTFTVIQWSSGHVIHQIGWRRIL